jgi:hypothetical protein
MLSYQKVSPYLVALAMGSIFACGGDKDSKVAGAPVTLPVVLTELDSACASPIFQMGRPMGHSELNQFGYAKYGLETVQFRNVLYRTPNEVESAYRVEVKMRNRQQFLVPESELLCKEEKRPSARSKKLARTTLPILGDLHLPSTRITVFDTREGDQLYNHPRISEVTVSSGGYFSFGQNWTRYKQLRTLSDYVNLLRQRHFYTKVDVRDFGYGRIAIAAEKNIGGEKAELLITLVETK